MAATLEKTFLTFTTALLGLYYKGCNNLTVNVGVSNARRFISTCSGLVAGNSIGRCHIPKRHTTSNRPSKPPDSCCHLKQDGRAENLQPRMTSDRVVVDMAPDSAISNCIV